MVKAQVEEFKKYYDLIQNGACTRLTDDGRKSPIVAWEFVSRRQKGSPGKCGSASYKGKSNAA